MPALSQDRELDQLLQQVKPEGRYLDLGILFRRLSIEADVPIADDTYLTAGDGTRLRVRNTPGGLVCGSNPPGASRHLADGTELAGLGGLRGVLRIETVARFGGRWDSLTASYCEPQPEDGPLQLLVFDLQESQVEFCRWFAKWWADFVAEQPREHSAAVVVDDRGGGKTLICLMLLIAAVLDRPKHADGAEIVAWAIIRSHSEREEVDREIRTWLPEHYYHLVTSPKPCLKLANGATIWLRSADDPEVLKQGRVDLAWINEGAKMDSRAFENALPRTKDRGGLLYVATNPPTPAYPPGEWIQELYERSLEATANHEENPIVFVKCSSSLNVAIDKAAGGRVATLLRWLSPERAAADVDGLILPVGKYAYRPPYCAADHLREFVPSEWEPQDITKQLTAKLCGEPAEWIFGHDFQFNPGNASVVLKAYGDMERPIFWVHSDFLVQGDEGELLTAIEADLEWLSLSEGNTPRFSAGNTIHIGDPSGSWQNYAHDKGKDSFAIFKARGWRLLPPIKAKDRDSKPPHPPVHLRIARLNGLLKQGRLFIVKSPLTEQIATSLKKCKIKRGTLGRIKPCGDEAHMTDALGYPIWWVLPRVFGPAQARRAARSLGAGWRNR